MRFKTKRQLAAMRRQQLLALKNPPKILKSPINDPNEQIPEPKEMVIQGEPPCQEESLTRKAEPASKLHKCSLCGIQNRLEQFVVCGPCLTMTDVFTGTPEVGRMLIDPPEVNHVAHPEVPQDINMAESTSPTDDQHKAGIIKEHPEETSEGGTNGEIVEKLEIVTHSCDNCPRIFDTKSAMKRHFNRCKNQLQKAVDQKWHTCSICSADFSQPSQLRDHRNKHLGIKPYKCRKDNCAEYFYGVRTRNNHERNCGKAPLECQICGKMFKTKRLWIKHQTVHSDERNYPCSVCAKRFKSSYAATVHMRIHTQEKPFSCPHCGQGFAYKCLVQPHVARWHSVPKED